MTSRKRSLDGEAAELAEAARALAKAKGICAVAAFVNLVKEPEPPKPKPMYEMPRVPWLPVTGKAGADEERRAKERKLRCDLEAALLRLDACCSPNPLLTMLYPTHHELETLRKLLEETARLISKKRVSLGWPCWEKVDRRFPKLKICRRMTGFIARFVRSIPPRKIAALIDSAESTNKALKEAFFVALIEARKGNRHLALVNWRDFEPVLLMYQNEERRKVGQVPLTVLRSIQGAPSGGPEIEAYVAVLELDRADLQWSLQFGEKVSTVKAWIWSLKNGELFGKLKPFCAGSVDEVEYATRTFEELKLDRKRKQAAVRKAKSREARKNLVEKA